MEEPTASNQAADDWVAVTLRRRANVSICGHLSHLMYRLHGTTRYPLKFVLSTQCRAFEQEYLGSKFLSSRLIMALDPEFLSLLLRSSAAIASSAVSLLAPLVCDRDTALHLSRMLPHVALLLSSFASRADAELDSTTRVLLDRSGCTGDVLRARVESDCLSFMLAVSSHLGVDTVHALVTDVLDLSEAVDDLSRDMFDLVASDSNLKGDRSSPSGYHTPSDSATSSTPTTDSGRCPVCSLIDRGDFKGASLELDHLFRDLDALGRAHIEDAKLNSSELSEFQDESTLSLGPILLGVVESAVHSLSTSPKDAAVPPAASVTLSSLRCALELATSCQFPQLLDKCLSCSSFDVLHLLFDLCNGSGTNFVDPEIQLRVSNVAVKLLDKNLHKSGVAVVSSFLAQMLERHGLPAIHVQSAYEGQTTTLERISAVVGRCEIEIHLALDDFCRLGHGSEGVVASFRLLETLLECMCDNEALLPSCHGLFMTIHRTMTTIFEFYDEVADDSHAAAAGLLTCCTRLVGCWMTLEPMHLKSQYLCKLPRILAVTSASDVAWLLPSFDYLDPVELDGVPGLLSSLLVVLSTSVWSSRASSQAPSRVPEGTEPVSDCGASHDRMTASMCYKLLDRLFLDGVSDCVSQLMSVDLEKLRAVSLPQLRGFDHRRLLEHVNVHFSPRAPLELLVPLPLELSTAPGACDHVGRVVEVVQSLFFTVIGSSHVGIKGLGTTNEQADAELRTYQDALEGTMSSAARLEAEWSPLLCEASLGTAAVCLCRLHQSAVREWMEPSAAFLVMECLAVSLAYACPRTTGAYADPEDRKTALWFRLALCCTVLLQRQPDFVNVLAFVCRQVRLRVPCVDNKALEGLVDDGWLSEDVVSASAFMCTLVASFRH